MLHLHIKRGILTSIFLFIIFVSPAKAVILEEAKILGPGRFDIGWGFTGTSYPEDHGEGTFSPGIAFRSGLGFLNYFDINLVLGHWARMNSAGLDLRAGLPKNFNLYGFSFSMLLGGYYASSSSEIKIYEDATSRFNIKGLYLPLEFNLSHGLTTSWSEMDFITGIGINYFRVISVSSQDFYIGEGSWDRFYTGKIALILRPENMKITKFIFDLQIGLSRYAKQNIGTTFLLGLLISVEPLDSATTLSF